MTYALMPGLSMSASDSGPDSSSPIAVDMIFAVTDQHH